MGSTTGGEPDEEARPDSTDLLASPADGPTAAERDQGFTTEVAAGTTFTTADRSTVTASVDLTTLSPNAVDQIVRTTAPDARPVTVAGGGRSLGPRVCPVV